MITSRTSCNWFAFAARALTCALALLICDGLAQAQDVYEKIRATGTLKVAVYKDFFPFSDVKEGGIDVDLANALAKRMNLKMSLLPFDAGDELGDDFRNMVWKGHYLGYGPADVMLHVPVDRVLQERNHQVTIFAPYYRETVRLAYDTSKIADWTGFESLGKQWIAVDGGSLSAQVMLGMDGGRYREQVVNARGIIDAVEAVKTGRAAALLATRSEIEAGLGRGDKYRVTEIAAPGLPPNGWVVGMAVKSGNDDLVAALNEALSAMIKDGELLQIFERHGVRYAAP